MTPYDHAFRAILEWHVKAEEFDRTLPGEWMRGQYWPAPGIAYESSLRYSAGLKRAARSAARAAGCTRTEWAQAEAAAEAMTYAEKRDRVRRGT